MNTAPSVLDLWQSGLVTAAQVAGPFLVAALAVGLLTSLIQAATQLQENILSFVPKLIAVGLVMVMSGHLLLDKLQTYTRTTIDATAVWAKEARQ